MECLSHAPSTEPHGDLISKRCCTVVNGQRQIIFQSHLNHALNLKYDDCQFKQLFFQSRKPQFITQLLTYKTLKICI